MATRETVEWKSLMEIFDRISDPRINLICPRRIKDRVREGRKEEGGGRLSLKLCDWSDDVFTVLSEHFN